MKQALPGVSVSVEDARRLNAAEGYIELGMYEEADSELGQIDSLFRTASQVLALKFCVYAGLGKWGPMLTIARKMAQHFPDDAQWRIWWASAACRAQSLECAKGILLDALKRHPNDPNIHYNLSCYESRLHHFRSAQRHLARAIQLEPKLHLVALNDSDLEPLWAELLTIHETPE